MVQPATSQKKNRKFFYSHTKTELSRNFLYFTLGWKSLKIFIFHETTWDFNKKNQKFFVIAQKQKSLIFLFHGYT